MKINGKREVTLHEDGTIGIAVEVRSQFAGFIGTPGDQEMDDYQLW